MGIPQEDLLADAARHFVKISNEWDDGDSVPLSTARVALLDAAHAYGVATGREGFTKIGTPPSPSLEALQKHLRIIHEEVDRLTQRLDRPVDHALTPQALRASIDTNSRAVDDVDRRMAALEAGPDALVGRVATLEAELNTLGAWADKRISDLERNHSVHRQAITHLKMNQGEPAWTKDDLDALLTRVVALESGAIRSLAVENLRNILEREKAEHAETLRRYDERVEEVEKLRELLVKIENLADFDVL